MNLGVQRCYNTFEHRMETVPIISLAFKISNKVTIELPLGNLVKHVVEDVVMKKERKIMAIEIKAIPTLEGKDAERFIERADEAERKFKGFDGIENTPAFKAMQSILRKSGMTK